MTVTAARIGFHIAGAGLSSARGASNRPSTSTTTPVSARDSKAVRN